MLLAEARKLRRLLSPEVEYRLRRGLNALIPVAHRSCHDMIYHVCVWKTASQWVRVVLSDPRVYRHSGLSVCLPNRHLAADPGQTRLPGRSIVAALVRDHGYFAGLPKPPSYFAFFVKRDPRDLIVSFYHSNRFSHPLDAGIARERARLAGLSERDGLMYTIGQFDRFVPILTSWEDAAASDPRILIVRYEDLTGPDRERAWGRLLRAADIALPDRVLADVLATYAFERITGGRAQGIEARADKYRKGIAGDWRNHFDGAMEAAFNARYGDVVKRLGYAP
jgi:hypothetical protein